MKRTLLIACTVLALTSCGSKQATTATTPVAPTAPTAPVAPVVGDANLGKSLFSERCAKCHRLYDPKEFSQQDWAPILKRMQPKARLDDAQMASVQAYVFSLAAQ